MLRNIEPSPVLYFLFALLASIPSLAKADTFQEQMRPFLVRYCVSCHGPDQQKADLRLDQLDPDMIHGSDADMWQEVLDLLNVSEMPPPEAKVQPTRVERQGIVDALTLALRQAMEDKRSTGGQNVLRRLTAYEYSNTLRDLLHLDLRYATDLPPEGVAKEGFKNNSSILVTSALHIEYFERIARSALNKIILAPEVQPQPYFVHVEPERVFKGAANDLHNNNQNRKRRKSTGAGFSIAVGDDFRPHKKVRDALFRLDHGEPTDNGILLAGNRPSDKVDDLFAADRKIGGAKGAGRSGYQPEFRVEMYEVPHDAPVLVRVRCSAVPGAAVEGHSATYPRLSFELGSFRGAGYSDQKEGGNIEVRSTEPKTYEFVVEGANFPFQSNKPARPSYFRIFNDFRRGTSQFTYEELPKLNIDWVEIKCNHYAIWPPYQKQAILFDSPNRNNEALYVREVLERFLPRAYRRPVTRAEVDGKVALFQRLRLKEKSFETTIISTLTSVLCSSHFLLISEPAPGDIAEDGRLNKRRLNDYELASRLSYFLWSSMPDETLFDLAGKGQLRQPSVLLAQTKRMLADAKAKSFSENFAAQWLDLAGIRRLAVNPEYFDFEEKTKDLFEEETTQFVHHILSENLSIENFIDSDFAVLNPDLARHYRIPGISGGIRVHTLNNEYHRGGLLTQASMLFGNSTGADTHPIKRGVWVLERMLDDPPPPPPPNVPDLPEPETNDESALSLKERLVAHADVASCRDCHARIDPWGVAFENYNALGQWREGIKDPLVRPPHQDVTIDPSTQLNNGKEIKDLEGLKAYILSDKKSQFRRAVVRKVMSYSLGRYLEFSDRASVDAICKAVEDDDDSFQTVIEQIVVSEPFLTK